MTIKPSVRPLNVSKGERMLSITDVMRAYRRSRESISEAIRSGALPAVVLPNGRGGRPAYHIHPDDALAYAQQGSVA